MQLEHVRVEVARAQAGHTERVVQHLCVGLEVAQEEDRDHRAQRGELVTALELAGVEARPVQHGALAERRALLSLHLHVEEAPVSQHHMQVEHDGLVGHLLAEDLRVADLDDQDGAGGLEHRGEEAGQDVAAGWRGEQQLEDDVVGGIEGAAHVERSNLARCAREIERDRSDNHYVDVTSRASSGSPGSWPCAPMSRPRADLRRSARSRAHDPRL